MSAAYDGNTGTSASLTANGEYGVTDQTCSTLISWQTPSTTYSGTSSLKITSTCSGESPSVYTAGGRCTVSYSWNGGSTWTSLRSGYGWSATTDSVAIPSGQSWSNIRVKVTAVGNEGTLGGVLAPQAKSDSVVPNEPPPGDIPPGSATLSVTEVWTEGETSAAAPTNLTGTAAATGLSVSLTWTDNATNETSYKVQRCTGSSCTPSSDLVTSLAANSSSYPDATTAPNTTYGYKSCAVNSGGASCSAVSYVTTPHLPAVPTALGGSAAANALSVSLTWTDNANNETSYKVQRCTGTGCTPTSNLVTNLAVNSVSYSDATTAPTTTYGYKACAVNGVGPSCSTTWYVTTPSPPTAPAGLAASAAETGLLVSLTWTDNANNETSYKVQRCTGTSCTPTSNLVTGLAVNSTSYSDATTARNTTYGYRACAVNDVSATCSATTYVPTPSGLPAAPSNVVAEAAPNGLAITLTWDDNATTETSYSVQRCQGANCVPTAFVTGLAANSVFYTDTTTSLNVTYGYSVCAINAVGSRCSTPTTYVTTSPVIAHTHYYISDHLGSTTLLVSSTGTIEAESEYYPYGGERVFVSDTTGNTYKFTDKERDGITEDGGLDYFGARYYGSNMGRFMSADWNSNPTPVPYADFSDPQTLNLYSYVRNTAETRFDVDGHFSIRDLWKVIVGIKPPPPPPPPPAPPVDQGAQNQTSKPRQKQTSKPGEAHKGEPYSLKPEGSKPAANGGKVQMYQVVDPAGNSVKDVSVQEQVKVVFAINADAVPNPNPVSTQTGEIGDRMGPNNPPDEQHSYLKTEQTFTAFKGGKTYPLTTKINQYIDVTNGKVIVQTVVLVP